MTNLKNIFWNDEEKHIRAGWRILSTYVLMVGFILLVQMALKPIFPDTWIKEQKIDVILFFLALISTIVVWFTRIRLDKKTFVSLGLSTKNGVFRDILAGYLIAAILIIIIFANCFAPDFVCTIDSWWNRFNIFNTTNLNDFVTTDNYYFSNSNWIWLGYL